MMEKCAFQFLEITSNNCKFSISFFNKVRKGVNNAMRHAHTFDEISTRIVS